MIYIYIYVSVYRHTLTAKIRRTDFLNDFRFEGYFWPLNGRSLICLHSQLQAVKNVCILCICCLAERFLQISAANDFLIAQTKDHGPRHTCSPVNATACGCNLCNTNSCRKVQHKLLIARANGHAKCRLIFSNSFLMPLTTLI